MTRATGARISFALLLVALVAAWRITRPLTRPHHPRPPPKHVAQGVAESVPADSSWVSRPADAASRPFIRPGSLSENIRIRFHVTTMDGTPVAGACARLHGKRLTVVNADANGTGSFDSELATKGVLFSAPGCDVVEVRAPLEQSFLEVKLPRGAALTIHVTTSAGAPGSESLSVRLESEGLPCLIGQGDPLWGAFGNPKPKAHTWGFGPRWLAVLVFDEDTIRLCPIRPATPITVSARSNLRTEAVTRTVEVAAGQSRVLDLVIPGDFGRLRGRVISPSGAAVPNARVVVAAPGAKPSDAEPALLSATVFERMQYLIANGPAKHVSLTTDPRGMFDFGAVPAEVFELSVESRDYVTWISKEHRVTADAAPLTITLDEGTSIGIRLIDGEGRPLPGAAVSVLDRTGKSDAEGRVRFEHLPRGMVSFDTFFGGVRTSFPHDTSVPEPTFQIQVINR